MLRIYRKNSYLALTVLLVFGGVFAFSRLAAAIDLSFPNPLVISEDESAQNKGINPLDFYAQVIGYLLSLVGILTFLFLLYGGGLWMTAGGSAERVGEAKKIFLWAVLGFVLVVSSYTVLKLIFQILVSSGLAPG